MTPAEWEARIMAVVDDLGLFLASEPDAKVDAALARMRQNLSVEFCALFPSAAPETMAAGVDCIVAAIQKRRRELEAAGGPPIAHEIADAILAETEPGAIPTNELMLREFVNAYELFDISPSESQHRWIADRVGALIGVRD